MDLHYYYGDCTTPEAQAQIKQNFIQLLNESFFKEVCQDPALKDKCKAENVKVTCSAVASVGSRRKRGAGMVMLHSGYLHYIDFFKCGSIEAFAAFRILAYSNNNFTSNSSQVQK